MVARARTHSRTREKWRIVDFAFTPIPFDTCDFKTNTLLFQLKRLQSSLLVWGVETGKKYISSFREELSRHLCQHHSPTKSAVKGRDQDLTNWIRRTDTYPVAYGGFNDVWSCQLWYTDPPPIRVAVKAIRPMIANDEEFQAKRKAVEQELRVWARLEHPNVLPLYGTTNGFGPFPAFVCPWADNGTLSEYLEKFGERLDLEKRMRLLHDIAAGLRYLHSQNVVHGDLSGSNVLITEDGRAWVSDFGLSTLLDVAGSGVSFPGNIRWAAPELFGEYEEDRSAAQLATREADIYSFGSVMFQILTGKLPFHGTRRVAQIVIMISQGNKPPREKGWDGKEVPDMLWQFVQRCWASSPSERPSCRDILDFVGCHLWREGMPTDTI